MEEAANELTQTLHRWFIEFVNLLPNLIIAAIVLVLAFYLAGVVQRGIRSAVARVSPLTQLNRLTASVARTLVVIAGLAIALSIIGLGGVVATILAGAGIIGLALGFAFQDIAANFMSGVVMAIRRPFREGDIIETNDFMGRVIEVNLRSTHIDTFRGQRVVVPNKDVLQSPLTNYSRSKKRRIDLACGVAYGDDLERAKEIALDVINSIEYRDESKPVDFYFNEFGGSSVDFVVRFWIDFNKQTDFLQAQHDAIVRLKRRFDEEDVTIPFPIRTLDFGVVGGEKLSDVLPPKLYEANNADGSKNATQDATASDTSNVARS